MLNVCRKLQIFDKVLFGNYINHSAHFLACSHSFIFSLPLLHSAHSLNARSSLPYISFNPRREARGDYGETGLTRKALRVFGKTKTPVFSAENTSAIWRAHGDSRMLRMLLRRPPVANNGVPASCKLVGKRRSDVAVLKIHDLLLLWILSRAESAPTRCRAPTAG